jgi:hypothetical protein
MIGKLRADRDIVEARKTGVREFAEIRTLLAEFR